MLPWSLNVENSVVMDVNFHKIIYILKSNQHYIANLSSTGQIISNINYVYITIKC